MHLLGIALSDELDPQAGQVRHDAAVVSSRGAGPNRYVLSYLIRILNYFHLRLMMKHWVAVVVYTTVKLMVVSSRDIGGLGQLSSAVDRGLGDVM